MNRQRRVMENRDPSGTLHFYMLEMESWNWYEYLRNVLTHSLGANLIEDLDGIWMRVATIQLDDLEFKLKFHEDLGNYLFIEPPSDLVEGRLREVVSKLFTEVKDVKTE